MSGRATGRVWGLNLPHSEVWVLMALADHADHDGGSIHPGIGLVAWKTGYSDRQVRRIMKSLVAKGILVPQEGRGPHGTYCYQIDWRKCPEKEAYDREAAYLHRKQKSQVRAKSADTVTYEIGETQDKTSALLEAKEGVTGPQDSESEDISTLKVRTFPHKSEDIAMSPESLTVIQNGFDDSNHPARARKKDETDSTGSPPSSAPPSSQANPVIYLNQVVADFSRELGDQEHIIQNASQARRLWEQSGMGAADFVRLLYDAKGRTREYQGRNGVRGIENKMAYFFTVVRDLLAQGAQTATGATGPPGEVDGAAATVEAGRVAV